MKIIDSGILAQSMFGQQNPVSTATTLTQHMFTGAGWTAFLMNGTMPTEADMAQKFAQDSLASLYNACVGVSRGLLTYVSQNNIVHTLAQARYEPKGVSYFKTINGAQYRQLTPNRITENNSSKRTICQLFAGNTPQVNAIYNSDTFGDGNFIVEFDSAVRLSHIYRNGVGTIIFSIVAIADDNTETSLGTFTASAADSNLFAASNPQTAKRFRIKPTLDSYTTMCPISILSDSAVYSAAPTELPKWLVLAHTNTRVCGDYNYSPLIPYLAENVGLPSTFVIRSVDPTIDNILYCPKIRFANRSV